MRGSESIPDQKKLRELYHDKIPLLNFFLNGVQERLSSIIQLPSSPAFKGRIKEFHGYYRKLLKLRSVAANELPFADDSLALPLYDSPELPLVTDLLGIRVVCAFLEDLNTVASQIARNFTVLEVEQKGAEQTFRELATSRYMC